jgi:DNA-binding MarR family transcriptional regulator
MKIVKEREVEDLEERNRDILSRILRAQVVVLRKVRLSASRQDLTVQQFGVLRFLSQRGPVPMYALGEELLVSPPVVTGIIDRLEAKGLVAREESLDDRRMTRIKLTNEGNLAHRKVREDYRSSLQGSLKRSLSQSEQETLADLLSRFSKEIRVLQ